MDMTIRGVVSERFGRILPQIAKYDSIDRARVKKECVELDRFVEGIMKLPLKDQLSSLTEFLKEGDHYTALVVLLSVPYALSRNLEIARRRGPEGKQAGDTAEDGADELIRSARKLVVAHAEKMDEITLGDFSKVLGIDIKGLRKAEIMEQRRQKVIGA